MQVVKDRTTTTLTHLGTAYHWLHTSAAKKANYRLLAKAADDLHAKHGSGYKMPDKYSNLDFIYEEWTSAELKQLLAGTLDDDESEVLEKHSPSVAVEFGCTAKLWTGFNDSLGLRHNYRVLLPGIQLAANNMPQGDVIQVPLVRYQGRQQQVHFLIHFENYTPDLGRKGFHRELTDFAKTVSRSIVEKQLSKYRSQLKANTGVAPDFIRELQISDWKRDMLKHEEAEPLSLSSEHFFKPTEKISITSSPTREQDVIALFHQLIAGGVIRGLNVMSTNERFTYDGLFKIKFDLDIGLYTHSPDANPLGVPPETAAALEGRVTDPRVLEYKYCLDGLIEDFDEQTKNQKDIDLCVAWTTGDLYKDRYGITSLLIPENADQRQFHGITHILTDLDAGAKVCDLIILSELIHFLNDQEKTAEQQRSKYE